MIYFIWTWTPSPKGGKFQELGYHDEEDFNRLYPKLEGVKGYVVLEPYQYRIKYK